MGTLINAVCPNCGFRKDKMTLFGGYIGISDQCLIPCYCKTCKTLFEGDMLKSFYICPNCSSEDVASYEDQSLGFTENKTILSWNVFMVDREVKLNENENLCPQCGDFSLIFENIGK